jgi:hypothetical protein
VLGDYLRTITASSKEDCSSLDYTINVGGTIQALGDSSTVANSKNINFSVLSATLRPESDKSATYLNEAKYCGVSDWAREKSTDVTNLDCQGTKYQKGDVVFDIYSLSSDKKELTFGKESFWLDKSKASDRPSELNPKRHFKH